MSIAISVNGSVTLFGQNTPVPTTALSSIATADSNCVSLRASTYPSVQCINTKVLISYSTRQIIDLPAIMSFATTDKVIGPTGVQIAASFTNLFAPATVITSSTFDAGVVNADDVEYWTGSGGDGTAGINCNDFTSTSSDDIGYSGWSSAYNSLWLSYDFPLCSESLRYLCICTNPTSSPTKAPTKKPTTRSPTKDPTKNPTKNPTKAPTKNPTKNPTGRPTKNPTKEPTGPTASPTKNPTFFPTSSPNVRVDKQQVMYKIPKGTRGRIYKGSSNNYTYFVMGSDINSPFNLTLSAQSIQPVLWEDVHWLRYNQTLDVVESQYTAVCNPIANRAPGEVITTFHQYPVCPTIYSCIDGSLTTISGGVYQDLRACIVNKTIVARTDVPNLPNIPMNVTIVDINASSLTPVIVQDIYAARLRCNDFIDRTINCQLKHLFKSAYRLQCVDEPIQCYTYAQGRFFGGLWNANPFYRYDIPRVNWTLAQYVGIASVMNYKIYARNGKFIDAFTSEVWNNYFWLGGVTSLSIVQQEVFPYAFTFQNDYIQGQEYNYLAGTLLPPPTASFASNPLSSTIVDCMVQIIFDGSLTGVCENQDWDNIDSVQWRIPSYIRYILIEPGTVVYSLTIETTYNYTGIEVYNVFGELCGTYLQPTGVNKNITISCLLAPSALNNFTTTSLLQVRYFGVHAIWDIPNATLSNSVPSHDADPFTISGYPFLSSTINLIYSVLYFFVYTVNGDIAPDEFNWPGRRNNISFLTDSRYFLNYTLNTTFSLGNTVDAVRQAILVNNTYPYNFALEAWVERNGYQEIPVNYSDTNQLDWLWYTWANSLSPRQCTEFSNCMTFGRGKCIFPSSPAIQYSGGVKPKYWRQGDMPPGYTIPNAADEGGCFIYDVYSEGFYDRQLAGARCKEGYGPADNANVAQIEQYQELVADVGVFTGSNCKLPAWFDPIAAPLVDYNLCSGHGKALLTQITSERTITQYSDGAQWLFPLCDSILLDQTEYVRQEVRTVFIQQFVNENSILSLIHGQVFLNGTVCTLASEVLTCSETYQFQCISTFFFSHANVEFRSDGLNLIKGLDIYDVSIGTF